MPVDGPSFGLFLMLLIAAGIASVLYFIPTILAVIGRTDRWPLIFAANLLTGWTGLGWFLTILWAGHESSVHDHLHDLPSATRA